MEIDIGNFIENRRLSLEAKSVYLELDWRFRHRGIEFWRVDRFFSVFSLDRRKYYGD